MIFCFVLFCFLGRGFMMSNRITNNIIAFSLWNKNTKKKWKKQISNMVRHVSATSNRTYTTYVVANKSNIIIVDLTSFVRGGNCPITLNLDKTNEKPSDILLNALCNQHANMLFIHLSPCFLFSIKVEEKVCSNWFVGHNKYTTTESNTYVRNTVVWIPNYSSQPVLWSDSTLPCHIYLQDALEWGIQKVVKTDDNSRTSWTLSTMLGYDICIILYIC